jgi:hypothetical protein
MDVHRALRELRLELERIDRIIARLEAQRTPPLRSTRGRKNMPESERADVSRRMKAYWATRKQRVEESAIAASAGG